MGVHMMGSVEPKDLLFLVAFKHGVSPDAS